MNLSFIFCMSMLEIMFHIWVLPADGAANKPLIFYSNTNSRDLPGRLHDKYFSIHIQRSKYYPRKEM